MFLLSGGRENTLRWMDMSSGLEQTISHLGEATYRGRRWRFGIRQEDRLAHTWVLGKTGTGKSTLLFNLMVQDLDCGRGFMLIDPHGDLVERILNMVPLRRMKDVLYFDPADIDYPIAFNVLEPMGLSPELVASGIMGALRKTWPEFWGPRMEYLLRSSLLTLVQYPGATLLDLHRLLVDGDFRHRVVSGIRDPQLEQFWKKEFELYAGNFRTEAVAPIANKTGQYLTSPMLRNLFGQRVNLVRLHELIDTGGIFLANLARGRVGEDVAVLLGSLLVNQVALAAMTRVNQEEATRRNFFLYVDEAHLVATRSIMELFPEARKFHLGIVLAHQYLEQLEPPLQTAIIGNVGSTIMFRLGARDAEVLGREFGPEFGLADLVNLPAYEMYVRMMIDGATSRPFSARTLRPLPARASYRSEIITESRKRYARPVEVVKQELEARWTGVS